MRKFIAGLIAGVSVLALTLIAVLLPPETFLQIRWRIISASLGALAVISMVLQGLWIKHDEDTQRKEREADKIERDRLYNLVHRILVKVEQRKGPRRKAAEDAVSLLDDLHESGQEVTGISKWVTPIVVKGTELLVNHLLRSRRYDFRRTETLEVGKSVDISREEAFDALEQNVMAALNLEDDNGEGR
jgi:hypothetical protein